MRARFNLNKLFFVLLILPVVAFAQAVDESVPPSDVVNAIVDLVKNWKAWSALAVAAASITIIVQALKTDILGNLIDKMNPFMKRLLITALGQVAGIILMVANGKGWIDAVVAGLFTSGGAVAIYESLKPLIDKKKV